MEFTALLHMPDEQNPGKIMSLRQYNSVIECIHYLKLYPYYNGLFVLNGNRTQVKKIIYKIETGSPDLKAFMTTFCTPRECASAFMTYLNKLDKPLFPLRVRQLLIAENTGVPYRVIALDALGLLQQEIKGRHLLLLVELFELMKTLCTRGSLRPTEMRVSHAPYLLLPLMFKSPVTSEQEIVRIWTNVANILNEMIMFSHLLVSNFDLSMMLADEKNRHEEDLSTIMTGRATIIVGQSVLRRRKLRHSHALRQRQITFNPPYIRGIM